MSLEKINEALSDIDSLRYGNKNFPKVSSNKINNVDEYDGSQGEYDEIIEIYSLGVDDLHLKLELRTDSYGSNAAIHSVQIVKPVIKQVTDFEPIK